MENSINSSNSEPSLLVMKSIFKKSTDFYQAFEVSLQESVVAGQSNKSEPDLDTSTGTHKTLPFKKSRKSVQQPFSFSLSDSLAHSENEKSETFVMPPPVFNERNKSLVDFFNVSFNETNPNLQSDTFSKSIDDSDIAYSKTNPFDKYVSENNIIIGNTSSMHVSGSEKSESNVESQRNSHCDTDGNEGDLTTFAVKQNLFKKANEEKSNSASQLHLSITDENKLLNINTSEPVNKNNSTSCPRLIQEADSSTVKNKSYYLEPKKSLQDSNSVISVTEERNNKSLDNAISTDPKQSFKNISLERSVPKVINSITSYLEQSSINDENLKDWMSDHSDEEIPLPRIPSVTANFSQIKEKPAIPVSPTVGKNSLSVWEQKLNEIVSKAEKRNQDSLKVNSHSSPKSKLLKKSYLNEKKPSEDLNRYKPPKLIKPAPFATKKLYEFIVKKLEPKYGIDRMIESENLVLLICDTVKKVTRRRTHQKNLIQNLKKKMAKAGLIETTMDFYEFVIKFLPYSFRVKVIPCLQPLTNLVYPPKDVVSPFDKIL